MEEVMNLVDQLALKLGVAVEYLWTILIKQQYTDGVIDVILAGLCILLLIALIILIPKLTKYFDSEYNRLVEDRKVNGTGFNGSKITPSFEEDKYARLRKYIPTYALWVGIFILFLTVIFVVSGIRQLINPEYFAFREILYTIQCN